MSNLGDNADDQRFANISTGDLPNAERVQALVDEAHRRFVPETGGANSAVYPALQRALSRQLGLDLFVSARPM